VRLRYEAGTPRALVADALRHSGLGGMSGGGSSYSRRSGPLLLVPALASEHACGSHGSARGGGCTTRLAQATLGLARRSSVIVARRAGCHGW